jgi:hypothetical protein
VFEFSSFRRAIQQSLSEGVLEVKETIEEASAAVTGALRNLPARVTAPLENASVQTAEAMQKLSTTLVSGFEQSATQLEKQTSLLASATAEVTQALKDTEAQLRAMQTPEAIIEIKLQPSIRGITSALRELSERQGAQIDQLRSAIDTLTAIGKEMNRAQSTQNQALERIIKLLSSNEELFRRLREDMSATADRQRERDAEILATLKKYNENQSTDTRARLVGWPWFRR